LRGFGNGNGTKYVQEPNFATETTWQLCGRSAPHSDYRPAEQPRLESASGG